MMTNIILLIIEKNALMHLQKTRGIFLNSLLMFLINLPTFSFQFYSYEKMMIIS